MDDRYNPKEAEARIADFWGKEDIYKYKKDGRRIYAIDTPPPTISGEIHVGHVYSYSQADFAARYKRMRGFSVFYPFGLDNNGLPTEILVEKQNKITAEHVGREKFVSLVKTTIKDYEQKYIDIWKKVGISVDWDYFYTTISDDVQKISQYSFIELYRMGRAYQKETPTIWCTKEKTALSQMELEDKMLKSEFVKIRFDDEIIIATTRPEMLPACVAIFVSPENEDTKKFVGRKVKVPIFGQEVEILEDRRVDPKKGTGVVMCCTFGDVTDIDWYKAYNLPLRIIIDEKGKMTHEYFFGKGIKEARTQIIEDLGKRGYLLERKEIEHAVNVHERCKTEIEFIVKQQWYIRYLDIKDRLIELGRELNWYPSHMRVRYENWIRGLQWDWNISRQRYFGIPFPVWYCKNCSSPILPEKNELPVNPLSSKPSKACTKCGSLEYIPEEDVMDTWATSSLTPLINSRWSLDNEMPEIFPMALRPQAHEIISFWLFTTIVKSYLHTGKLPWRDAMISGHALDPKGKAMHKSLGNVTEPMPLIEKYGADALRYWASSAKLGEDATFQEKEIIAGSRLMNKLWNIAKFVEKNRDGPEEITNIIDKWIISKLREAEKEATDMFDVYNYAGSKRAIEEFFWFFCDNYVEFIKYRIYNGDKSSNYTLNMVFLSVLKMLAPFMPYITEEIYLVLYSKSDARSIHVSEWPDYNKFDNYESEVSVGDKIWKTVVYVRQWKHSNGMALNAELEELTVQNFPKEGEMDLRGSMNIKKIAEGRGELEIPGTEIKISFSKR
jgi:valyl-tRNA synthetase